MSKKLNEMTLEELWRLFPIILTEHKPYWAEWYKEEANELKAILPDSVKLHHVGSTAINGIYAKPIIDILIVANSDFQSALIANTLKERGYILMSASENRISLNKGYTETGFAERVFHLHIRQNGDTDEIYFRDFLNTHPRVAKKYEKLKLRLWKEYEFNRDAYTEAKTEFVKKYTEAARRKLTNN